MAFIRKYGTTQLISSRHPQIGLDCVYGFERQWALSEVDTMQFNILDPATPLLIGNSYEIFTDYQLTRKLGNIYLLGLRPTKIAGRPFNLDDTEILAYNPFGTGPTNFLKKKRLNIRYSNIQIHDLVKILLDRGMVEYGVQQDYSFIQEDDFTLNVRFVDKTPWEILTRIKDLGYDFYVDDQFYFHFHPVKNDMVGFQCDEETAFISTYAPDLDITELKNSVLITGGDKETVAPELKIIGTGDLTTGLDYALPNNVVFDQDYTLESWQSLQPQVWATSDPKGSTNPLSPDGSRVFEEQSSLYVDGSNGVQGSTYVQKIDYAERAEGLALIQNLTLDDIGDGFLLAFGDGNGAEESNLFGFYLNSDGSLTIKEAGNETVPSPTINLKRSYSGTGGLTITNLSIDNRSFNVPSGKSLDFSVGENIVLVGDSVGIFGSTITAINTGTDLITIADQLTTSDLTNAKLNRVVDYQLSIQVKTIGYAYKIQGGINGEYGLLNSSLQTTVATTVTDDTEFLFPIVAAPKDDSCKIVIDSTLFLPPGGASYEQDGEFLLVAPEELGTSFNIPILIRAADPRKNPPLLRFRPSRLTSTVFGATATTTVIPLSEGDWNNVFDGDRLLINTQETFITNKTLAGFTITVSPALTSAPADADLIHVGTTAPALGQDGKFNYKFPTSNKRIFRDTASIATYGLSVGEPIVDETIKTNEDLNRRWEAYADLYANPKIVGNATVQIKA